MRNSKWFRGVGDDHGDGRISLAPQNFGQLVNWKFLYDPPLLNSKLRTGIAV